MSITSRLTTMQPERADRVLSVVERFVKGREGVWVRLHSFVVASSIGVSLLAGNRQGRVRSWPKRRLSGWYWPESSPFFKCLP